ncbi:MAG TPA: transporter suffix domain-containing protein [Thermoanaerobaculia bacterium]
MSGAPRRARYLGFALLALAFLMWVLVPVSLLPPLSAAQKGWSPAALLVAGEVAFWVSAVLFGKEVIRRHRAHLDLCRLFRHGNP